MDKFINYCSKEQTKRAYKLGAPIFFLPYQFENNTYIRNKGWGEIPTTQQMIGWLESQNIQFDITPYIEGYVIKVIAYYNYDSPCKVIDLDTKLDAIMAAIDSALDYLEKGE